jgi:hypothetical protein
VLHGPRQIAEPDVNELHIFIRDESQHLVGVLEH